MSEQIKKQLILPNVVTACAFANFGYKVGAVLIKIAFEFSEQNDKKPSLDRLRELRPQYFIDYCQQMNYNNLINIILTLTTKTHQLFLECFDLMRMLSFSLLIIVVLCKFDLNLIRHRMTKRLKYSNEIKKCYEDLQTVYFSQITENSMILSRKAEQYLFVIQVTFFIAMHLGFQFFLNQYHPNQQVTFCDFYQIVQSNTSYILINLFQITFLLALNGNCCGILILNLVFSANIDQHMKFCHFQMVLHSIQNKTIRSKDSIQFFQIYLHHFLKKGQYCSGGQNLMETVIQISFTIGYLILFKQKMKNQNIQKINEFNNHLISDQFQPNDSSLVALVTLDNEDIPFFQENRESTYKFQVAMINQYIRKLRTGRKTHFQNSRALNVKILRFDFSKIQIESQILSTENFCKIFDEKFYDEFSSFLSKALNFYNLGNGPAVLKHDIIKETIIHEVALNEQIFELKLNQKFNMLSVKIIQVEKPKHQLQLQFLNIPTLSGSSQTVSSGYVLTNEVVNIQKEPLPKIEKNGSATIIDSDAPILPKKGSKKNRNQSFNYVDRKQSQNSQLSFAELVDEQLKSPQIIEEQKSESESFDCNRRVQEVSQEPDIQVQSATSNTDNGSQGGMGSSGYIVKRCNNQNCGSCLLNNSQDIMKVFEENSNSIDTDSMQMSNGKLGLGGSVKNDSERGKKYSKIQSQIFKNEKGNNLESESFSKEVNSAQSGRNYSTDVNLFFDQSLQSQKIKQIKVIQLRKMLADQIQTHSADVELGKCINSKKISSTSLVVNGNSSIENAYKNIHFKKILKLQQQLKNNKIFMNMVIHDMRNPTNAIQFGVTETIQMLHNQKKKVESIKKMRKQRMTFINSQVNKIQIINQQLLRNNRSNSSLSESGSVCNSGDNKEEESDHSKFIRGLIQGFQPIQFERQSSQNHESHNNYIRGGQQVDFSVEGKDGKVKALSQSINLSNKRFYQKKNYEKNHSHNVPMKLQRDISESSHQEYIQNLHFNNDSEVSKKKSQNQPLNLINYQAHYYGASPILIRQISNSDKSKKSPVSVDSHYIEENKVEVNESEEFSQIIQRNQSKSIDLHLSFRKPKRAIKSHIPRLAFHNKLSERAMSEVPIDLSQIEMECDFEDIDEMIRLNEPKALKINKNEMSKINNNDFYLKLKKQLEDQVHTFNGDMLEIQRIQATLERLHDLAQTIHVRERVVIQGPPMKNMISRASQCEIEMPAFNDQNQLNSRQLRIPSHPQRPLNRELPRRAHSRYSIMIEDLDFKYDKKIQCDLGESDVLEENIILKKHISELQAKQGRMYDFIMRQNAQNKELKNHIYQLQQQYKNQGQIIEIQSSQLDDIEEQCVLEKSFLEKIEKFLQNAVFSATMLGNLINDMLDLAKFEAGTFLFHNDFFDLIEIIEQAFETIKYQAEKKEISVKYQVFDQRNIAKGNMFIPKNNSVASQSKSLNSVSQSSKSGISDKANLENNGSNNPTIKSQSTVRVASDEVKNMFYQLFGDKNRYMQIVLNFLSNSIHYTKKNGQIQINLVLLEEQLIKQRSDMHTQVDVDDLTNRQLFNLEENSGSKYLSNKTSEVTNNSISDRVSQNQVSNISIENKSLKAPRVPNQCGSLQESSINEVALFKNKSLQIDNNNSQGQKLESEQQQSKFVKFRIEIADTGVGIKQEDLGKLFTDFSRLDKGMNNKGTGLGLSICKKMIEKMGGKVEVDSTFGVGTTFKVTLQTKCFPHQKIIKKEQNNSDHSVSISNNVSSSKGNLVSISESESKDSYIRIGSSKNENRENIFKRKFSLNNLKFQNNEKRLILEQSNSSFYMSSNQNSLVHHNSSNYFNFNLSNSDNDKDRKSNSIQSQNSKNSYISVMKIGEQNQQQPSSPLMVSQKHNLSKHFSPNFLEIPNNHLHRINEDVENSISMPSVLSEEEVQNSSKIHNFALQSLQMSHQSQSQSSGREATSRMNIFDPISEKPELELLGQLSNYNQSNNSQKLAGLFSFGQSLRQKSQSIGDSSAMSFDIDKSNSKEEVKIAEGSKEEKINSQMNILKKMKNQYSTERKISQNRLQPIDKKVKQQSHAPQSELIQPKKQEYICLVANDCDFQLMQINMMLKKVNVKVTEAINGLEALEVVRQSKNKFDFIILDLNMPIMDGYDACKQIIDHYSDDKLMADNSQQDELKCQLNQLQKKRRSSSKLDENQILIKSQQVLELYGEIGYLPILVALSAHISDDVRNKCLNAGFNIILEAPLTVKKIEDEILIQVKIDKQMSNNIDDLIKQQLEHLGEEKSSSSDEGQKSISSAIPIISIKQMGQLEKVDEQSNSHDQASSAARPSQSEDSEFSIEK